jgi:hypothetical protein
MFESRALDREVDLSALPDRSALRAFLYQEFFAKR